MIVYHEALWVKLLRAKYNCGGLLLRMMRCGSRVSHLWRGICQSWDLIELIISWVMRNG